MSGGSQFVPGRDLCHHILTSRPNPAVMASIEPVEQVKAASPVPRAAATRYVCGWCPTELPDDYTEWSLHHFVVHGVAGYSVRHYPLLSIEDEMAALTGPDTTDGLS